MHKTLIQYRKNTIYLFPKRIMQIDIYISEQVETYTPKRYTQNHNTKPEYKFIRLEKTHLNSKIALKKQILICRKQQ